MSDSDLKEKETSPQDLEDRFGDQFSPEEKKRFGDLADNDNPKDDDQSDDGEEDQIPFTDDSQAPRRKGWLTRKKTLLGGGILTLTGAGAIGVLLTLLPTLRLESYMAKINQRAFAIASNAVENRASYLLERYLITSAVNLDACGSVVNNTCRADYSKSGIAGSLFTTMRDAKIENTLADRYGIKIESLKNPDRSAGANRFTITNRSGKKINISNGDIQRGSITGGSRELGRDFRKFLREETKWYEVMHRKSVRKYLNRKHGVRLWCFFACKTRDNVEVRASDAKTRYKYRFVERFVFPFSGKYGLMFNCFIAGGDKCGDGEELRKNRLDRNKVPDEDISKVVKFFKGTPTGKPSQFVVEQLLTKLLVKQGTTKAIVSNIPVAGQIYLGLSIVDMLNEMDNFIANNGLSHFAADFNSRQYLEFYSGMRNINDEMKSHVLGLDEVGVVMEDFEGAEESLVYQAYNNPKKTASLFTGTAYAQAAQPNSKNAYVCADDKPIPAGELVCREKKIARTFKIEDWRNNKTVDQLVEYLSGYKTCSIGPVPAPEIGGLCIPPAIRPSTVVHPTLNFVNAGILAITGPVIDQVTNVLLKIPGLGLLAKFVEGKFKELINFMFEKVFPLPVNVDSPGREKHDGLEAGADVASSEFAKGGYTGAGKSYGLGAPAISDAEVAAITQEFNERQEDDYKNSGFIARLTDMEYQNSFMNQAIAQMPRDISLMPTQLVSGFIGSIANIFSGKSFGYFLGSTTVRAQLEPSQGSFNAFGVQRFGYSADDPSFTRDPGELTPEKCEQIKNDWEKSKTEDALTGNDLYSTANPCLLEEVTVDSVGSIFTDE